MTQLDPDGGGILTSPVTTFGHMYYGNHLTSVTDPLSHTTTYAYDNIYRRKSITDANSGVTSFTYDAAGNLLTLKDPVNNTTTWGYDNLNRAVSETNQLGFSRSFAYNAAGDLTSKVDRNGRKTTYEYDALRRQTAEKWRDGSDNVIRTISSTFNSALDLTNVSDPAAAFTYVYDNLGRVTQQTQDIAGLTPDVILAQQFDAASNRTKLSATIGTNTDFVNDYTYDNLSRLTTVTQQSATGGGANVVAPKRVDFSYFADGQFDTISRYQSTSTTSPVAQTYHLYDGIGRLTDLDHKQSTTVLAGYDYVYDAASRITSINSTVEGLSSFTYDVTDQLTGADHATPRADESYSYNLNGSRTMTGYVTGTNNQTTSDGTFNYEYDNEGNMVKKTTIADGAYEQYTWDYRNRLTTITFKDSSHVVLKTVDHAYDAYNRQVRRTFDSDGPGSAVAVDQFFAYDRYNAVLEFSGSSDTNLSHRYLWGPAVDQILADEQVISLSTAGNSLWALSDHLGTPRDIADLNEGSGVTSVTNHRTYQPVDKVPEVGFASMVFFGIHAASTRARMSFSTGCYTSFGVRTAETNSSVDLLLGFTGKAFDEITGLQNNVNRLYDAALGQWRSEDPTGFRGQDTNLRRNVHNKQLNFIDPDGLEEKAPVYGPALSPPVKNRPPEQPKLPQTPTVPRPRPNEKFIGAAPPRSRMAAAEIARIEDAIVMAKLSQAAYKGADLTELQSLGYRVLEEHYDDVSGFRMVSFMHKDGTVVLAYAGTTPLANYCADDLANIAQGTGFRTDQYVDAYMLAGQYKIKYGSTSVRLTGHSLGGGLAAMAAMSLAAR